MKSAYRRTLIAFCAALFFATGNLLSAQTRDTNSTPEIRTPPASPAPRINGPDVFGVRPGNPFLYQVPATGDRPMTFSTDHLPRSLKLDAATGRLTGKLHKKWFGLKSKFVITLHA